MHYRGTAGIELASSSPRQKTWDEHAWRARGARAYYGDLGRSPQWGPEAEPLVRESGATPPEAEHLLAFGAKRKQ